MAMDYMNYSYGLEAIQLKQVHRKLFDFHHGNHPPCGMLPIDMLEGGNVYAVLWDIVDGSNNHQIVMELM
jgi:hypothetical protein